MREHTPGPWQAEEASVRGITQEWFVRVDGDDIAIASDIRDRNGNHSEANARLIAAAPELHEVADELFSIVAEERECYLESHRNQATGEVPDVCMPYLERLDAALNKARAVFAKATQP